MDPSPSAGGSAETPKDAPADTSNAATAQPSSPPAAPKASAAPASVDAGDAPKDDGKPKLPPLSVEQVARSLRANKGYKTLTAKHLGRPVAEIDELVDDTEFLKQVLEEIKRDESEWVFAKMMSGIAKGNSELISLYFNKFCAEQLRPLPADYQDLFDHVDFQATPEASEEEPALVPVAAPVAFNLDAILGDIRRSGTAAAAPKHAASGASGANASVNA